MPFNRLWKQDNSVMRQKFHTNANPSSYLILHTYYRETVGEHELLKRLANCYNSDFNI